MFRGMFPIIYKECIHILRDPKTLFLMLLVPGLQMTIFGYAIDLDVKHIKTVVYNLDGRAESRELIHRFENTGTFDVVAVVNSDAALLSHVVQGRAQVALKIPPGYSDALLLGTPAAVQVMIDGSDSTIAMQALNVANAIALQTSLQIVSKTLDVLSAPPVEIRSRVLFNPDMKTPNFMVPGLVGIVMQVVTLFLTAFAIVREKETGTLEQLMVTPVSRLGLMLGKLMPYAVIGIIETIVVLLIMRFIFGVSVTGSLALLAAASLLFLFTVLGMGLMISTVAENQVQAMQIAFVIMLPSVLLSGFVFPQDSMPLPIYIIGQFIPATYFINILRGIILRGADFNDLWPQAAYLAAIGLAVLGLSTRRFRKTLG